MRTPELELKIIRDPKRFSDLAGDFLAARPERNILATILEAAVRGRYAHTEPLFALLADTATGEPRATAMRTPPWPMLAAGLGHQDLEPARRLMAAWLEHDPRPPGLSAEPPTARTLATAYRELTGAGTSLHVQEAMHSLTEVTDPPSPPPPGRLRRPTTRERDTLIAWDLAFTREAATGSSDPAEAARRVDGRFAEQLHFVWCTSEDRPVSVVGYNPAVAGIARIGPVYTPPEHRANGYATAATAAVSRHLLATLAQRCMLLTDLANPTSNRIYASIGYVRFAEWEEHRFDRPRSLAGPTTPSTPSTQSTPSAQHAPTTPSTPTSRPK